MKIKSIRIKNFKSIKDETFEIGDMTIVSGKNATGKTSILEALSLGILGYLPSETEAPLKQGNALFGTFASGNPMEVELFADDGTSYVRSWEQKRGSVSYSGHKGSLVSEDGFDLKSFTGLSGPAKIKKLALLYGSDATATEVSVQLGDRLLGYKFDGAEKTESASCVIALRRSLEPRSGNQNGLEWLEQSLDRVSEQRKNQAQVVQRLKKALEVVSNDEDQMVSPDVEVKFKEKQALCSGLTSTIAARTSEIASLRKNFRDIKERLAKAVDFNPLKQIDAATVELADKNAALTKLQEEFAKKHKKTPIQPENLKAAVLKLGLSGLIEQKARIEFSISKSIGLSWKLGDVCGECGQVVTAEHAKKSLLELSAKKEELELIEIRKFEAEAESDRLRTRFDLATSDQENIRSMIVDVKNAESKIKALQSASASMESISDLTLKLDQTAASGESMARELDQIKEDLEVKSKELAELDLMVKKLMSSRASEAAREKTVAQLSNESIELDALVAFESEAKGLMLDIVNKAVRPIVDICEKIGAGCLPSGIDYVDGEIIFSSGNGRRRSASDSERLVLDAGLSVALAAKSSPRIAIINRLESFDESRKKLLLSNLLSMIGDGEIDQCFLVEVSNDEPKAIDGIDITSIYRI